MSGPEQHPRPCHQPRCECDSWIVVGRRNRSQFLAHTAVRKTARFDCSIILSYSDRRPTPANTMCYPTNDSIFRLWRDICIGCERLCGRLCTIQHVGYFENRKKRCTEKNFSGPMRDTVDVGKHRLLIALSSDRASMDAKLLACVFCCVYIPRSTSLSYLPTIRKATKR